MSERDPRGPAPDERVNERGASERTDIDIEKRIPQPSAAGVAKVGEVPAAMHRPPTLALPPGQTFWLCVIHGLRCFGDRAWSFFIPVYVFITKTSLILQGLRVEELPGRRGGWRVGGYLAETAARASSRVTNRMGGKRVPYCLTCPGS